MQNPLQPDASGGSDYHKTPITGSEDEGSSFADIRELLTDGDVTGTKKPQKKMTSVDGLRDSDVDINTYVPEFETQELLKRSCRTKLISKVRRTELRWHCLNILALTKVTRRCKNRAKTMLVASMMQQ